MILPKHFGRNAASSYLLSGVVSVAALVITPILVRGLGRDAYGVWALTSSLVLYFKLLEFGIGKAIPRFVAEHGVTGDDALLSRAISTALALLCLVALVAGAVAVVVTAAFPFLFGVPDGLRTASQITVAFILVDICYSIAADAFGWTLTGLQRFDVINLTLIAVITAQTIAWAVVIALGGGLISLAAVSLAISLVGQTVRYGLARRLLPRMVVAPRRQFDRALVRPFLRRSSWIGIIDVAAIVVFRLDVVVVGLIVGLPAAAIYAVGQKLTFALEQLIQPVTKPFFPHASALGARQDVSALRESMLLGTRASLLVATPLALTLSLLAGPIVHVWVGGGFAGAAHVVVLLACANIVAAMTRTGLLMLQATTEPRVPALIYGSEAVLNLGLSVGLAFALGAAGVALGTLIATGIGAMVFIPYMCNQFGLRLSDLLGPLLIAHAPCIAVALAIDLLTPRALLTTFSGVAAVALAMLGSYLVMFALTGLSADERRHVIRLVRATRGRRASKGQTPR